MSYGGYFISRITKYLYCNKYKFRIENWRLKLEMLDWSVFMTTHILQNLFYLSLDWSLLKLTFRLEFFMRATDKDIRFSKTSLLNQLSKSSNNGDPNTSSSNIKHSTQVYESKYYHICKYLKTPCIKCNKTYFNHKNTCRIFQVKKNWVCHRPKR